MLNPVDFNRDLYINLIFAIFLVLELSLISWSRHKFSYNNPSYLSNKSLSLLEYPRVSPCKNEYHKKRLETLQLTPWRVSSLVPNIYLNDMLNRLVYAGHSRFES